MGLQKDVFNFRVLVDSKKASSVSPEKLVEQKSIEQCLGWIRLSSSRVVLCKLGRTSAV